MHSKWHRRQEAQSGFGRAVDKVVAQVSQPAVSQGFQPADAASPNTLSDFRRAADWKSAIRQVGNLRYVLRYVLAARRHGVLIDIVNGPAGFGALSVPVDLFLKHAQRCARFVVLVALCMVVAERLVTGDGANVVSPRALPETSALTAGQSVRLMVQQGYLPSLPVLVRVEIINPLNERDVSFWDGEAVLSVDLPNILLSPSRVRLRNGMGSALVTINGGGNFHLIATVGQHQTSRPLKSLSNVTPVAVGGTLSGSNTTWSGVVQVTNDVIVPAGHTLTLLPDTLVLVTGVASGTSAADLEVRGALLSQGTEDQPVTITCASAGLNWGQIRHVNAQPSLYRFTTITRAGRAPGEGHTGTGPAIKATNSKLTFESCSISDHTAGGATIGKIMTATGCDLVFNDCHLARARMGPEIDGTSLLCTNSYIYEMSGPDDCDGIYLHNQKAGQTITLTGCVIAAGDDDGIDTLGSTITVENCLIRDWRNPQEDAKGVSVFNGATSLRRCLITDCTVAVSAKWSSGPATRVFIDRSTIVALTNAVNAAWKANAPGPHIDYRITNSILLGVEAVHTDFGATNFSIGYCLLSQPWPGTGNIVGDPHFVNATSDFHLLPGSPCIDAGDPSAVLDPDGTRADMGVFPFLQVAVNRPALVTPLLSAEGQFRFSIQAEPNRSYTVEAGTNLTEWKALITLFITNTRTEWLDIDAPGYPRRFYRLRAAP